MFGLHWVWTQWCDYLPVTSLFIWPVDLANGLINYQLCPGIRNWQQKLAQIVAMALTCPPCETTTRASHWITAFSVNAVTSFSTVQPVRPLLTTARAQQTRLHKFTLNTLAVFIRHNVFRNYSTEKWNFISSVTQAPPAKHQCHWKRDQWVTKQLLWLRCPLTGHGMSQYSSLQPGEQVQVPLMGSQAAPLAHWHVWLQLSPQVPLEHGMEQSTPCQPGKTQSKDH